MRNLKSIFWRRWGLLAAVCVVLSLQANASRWLTIDETKLGVPNLRSVPLQLGQWQAQTEQTIDAGTLAYLKPDDYILRDYADLQQGTSINLFVAYFKSLQSKYGPHSPRICLPGSGWNITSSSSLNLTVPGRKDPIPVNQFTMEKSNDRILTLYWYQNDRNVWAQDFYGKLLLLPDLLRYRRSDVSLVRLVTSMRGYQPTAELKDSEQFARKIFPLLVDRFSSVN